MPALEARAPAVLVVDDRDANLELIGMALEQAGYAVHAARSGAEALAQAQAHRPDLVLLDILMPGMDGCSTCRALRAAGFADVPVIFVTGANDGAMLVDAFAAGAVDYITKPFLVEELLARVRTHLDLKIARDRLGEMLRERAEATHVVAHDLKNPISAALFAARLLQNSDDAQRRTELVDDIISATGQAIEFIQRFLAGGSHEHRLRSLCIEPVDLHDIALLAVRAQRPAAEARGMDLVVRGMAQACADQRMASNVVQNLLSNAIRYAPPHTPVEIEISDTRTGHARLLVMDRGPGIPDAMRGQLFRRYARLLSEQDVGGEHSSGLGLAIAKRDVTQMGGHLWYEPRVGGGAVFGVELPQQPALSG